MCFALTVELDQFEKLSGVFGAVGVSKYIDPFVSSKEHVFVDIRHHSVQNLFDVVFDEGKSLSSRRSIP